MPYKLGVSTGLFSIAKSADPEGRHEYLGIPRKALWSITKGVNFAQVDLESMAEFIEPELDKKIEDLEKMGVEIGIHGEAREYTSVLPFLDSALEEEWHRSHERLVKSLEGSGLVKSKYFLLHASASMSWQLLWRDLQPTKLADIWGRGLSFFFDQNTDVLDWAVEQDFVTDVIRGLRSKQSIAHDAFNEMLNDWLSRNPGKALEEAAKAEMERKAVDSAEQSYRATIKHFVSSSDETYGSERIAYYCIAKWMQDGRNCPQQLKEIWKDICKDGDIDDKKWREEKGGNNWVPAVTCAYTWGHFNPEKCGKWPPKTKQPTDPKPILEKHKMWFVLETPMTGAGEEEQMRLGRPIQMLALVKRMGTPWGGLAFDWEHQLSGNIDPMKESKELPEGAGRLVKVIHAGYPAVVSPAHVPIPMGSEAQKYAYDILWELRKKGFKEGWIIFERGGGQEPVKESIQSLRLCVKYLEMDIPPDKLPDAFYGFEVGGIRWTRQQVAIRDHALEPLKGLLSVPEEEYGFMSTAAAAKGKLEEWKKSQLK
jgi:hypothetical protein